MTEQRKRKAAKAPVSAHPAFPAIVALWFAALLGLGSLVLPVALFENLSEASGLSQYLVAAQPPLGSTARILIALAAAGIGALAGFGIARQVVASGAPRANAPPQVEPLKEPIRAHDELGEDGFDADFADFADDSAQDDRAGPAPVCAPADSDPAHEPLEPAPLDLAGFDEADADADDWITEDAKREARDQAASAAETLFPKPSPADLASEDPDEAEDHAMTEFARETPEEELQTAVAEPVATPSGPVAIVELVDRFARALQQHRENVAAQVPADAVVDLTVALAGKQTPEPAAAAPFAEAPHPQDFDAFDDETDEDSEPAVEEAYSSLLGVNRSFAPSRKPVFAEDDDDASDEAEGTAIEPVVVFPEQAGGGSASPLSLAARPAASSATERALRDALAKLEKMSGAA